jgi:predicted transcriptional regulator
MTTVELKHILMKRIAGINDKSFLNAIMTIIETKSETTIYKTTPSQRERINEGRTQITKGEIFTDEEVDKEIDKWLKEK